MKVIKCDKATCEEFVLKKHYSHRTCIFWAGFALVENGMITGVALFGMPSPPINKHSFADRDFRLWELSRVVVQSKTKNASSFLIANALKQLPQPCAVVSYADSEQNHCGIIYQATNWIYTGATVSHDHAYILNGKRIHPMTLRDMGIKNNKQWAKDNNVETVKPLPKHRYFFLCGNRHQKKEMLKKLNYPVLDKYPKTDQARYDDGPQLEIYANEALL